MKKNTGTIDRVVRILLAVLFAVLFFTETVTGLPGIILLVLGGVFLLTAAAGFCPIYYLVGVSTCKTEDKKS